MSIFERWIHVDLEAGPYKDTVPNGFFQRDAKANRLGVIVSKGHEKVELSGTVQGIAKLPIDDGSNLFEFTGFIDSEDSSKVYVDLPSEVYLNNGMLTVAIRLVNGNDKIVLATFSGYVSGITDGTPTIPVGTLPDDIDEFLAQLAQMRSDSAEARAAVEAVDDALENLNDTIAGLRSAVFNISTASFAAADWQQGSIQSTTGRVVASGTTRINTLKTAIGAEITTLSAGTGYEFLLYGWDGETYLGAWNGTQFQAASGVAVHLTSIDLTAPRATADTFVIVGMHNDTTQTIGPSDGVNFTKTTVTEHYADAAVVNQLVTDVSGLEDDTSVIYQKIGNNVDITADVKAALTDGYYVSAVTGSSAGNANYSRTGFISCGNYRSIRMTAPIVPVNSGCGIAFYSSASANDFLFGYRAKQAEQAGYESIVVPIPPDATHYRLTWFSSNGDFAALYNNFSIEYVVPGSDDVLAGKTFLNFGDSIAAGGLNIGRGYAYFIAGEHAMKYLKYAVSGSTLSDAKTDNVLAQIDLAISEHPNDQIDYVLVEGWTNDFAQNVAVGELVDGYDIVQSPRNTTTIIGALETAFGKLRAAYPAAKIIFVCVHKNGGGITLDRQIAYHDGAVSACKKWSVTVADVFDEGQINSFIDAMLPVCFDNANGGDKTHPGDRGARDFYAPLVASKMTMIAD